MKEPKKERERIGIGEKKKYFIVPQPVSNRPPPASGSVLNYTLTAVRKPSLVRPTQLLVAKRLPPEPSRNRPTAAQLVCDLVDDSIERVTYIPRDRFLGSLRRQRPDRGDGVCSNHSKFGWGLLSFLSWGGVTSTLRRMEGDVSGAENCLDDSFRPIEGNRETISLLQPTA